MLRVANEKDFRRQFQSSSIIRPEIVTSLMKQLNHCSLGLVFLSFLLFGSLAYGQDASQAGNKKPRTPEDYQPRALREIFAMKPDRKDLRDKQDRLVVTADILPSVVEVTHTGSTR